MYFMELVFHSSTPKTIFFEEEEFDILIIGWKFEIVGLEVLLYLVI